MSSARDKSPLPTWFLIVTQENAPDLARTFITLAVYGIGDSIVFGHCAPAIERLAISCSLVQMIEPEDDDEQPPAKRVLMPWDVEDLNRVLRAIADEEIKLVFYVDPVPENGWKLSGGTLPAPVFTDEAKEGADRAQALAKDRPGVCYLRDAEGRIIKSREW